MSALPEITRLAGRVAAASQPAPGDTGREKMGREIRAALHEATATPGWLPPERRRASHENYTRHLIYADPEDRFSILAIVWDRGQTSPIHGHHCWCAVGVYQGLLMETYFREGAVGQLPVETGSARHAAGETTFDSSGGIHRIGNYSGVLAISLHVYGVAKDRISTHVNRLYPTA